MFRTPNDSHPTKLPIIFGCLVPHITPKIKAIISSENYAYVRNISQISKLGSLAESDFQMLRVASIASLFVSGHAELSASGNLP